MSQVGYILVSSDIAAAHVGVKLIVRVKVDLLHALNVADVVPRAHQMKCVTHKYSHVNAVLSEHNEVRTDGGLNLLNEYV